MIYSNFRIICVFRIAAIGLTIWLLVYLYSATDLYATMSLVALAVLLQMVSLIHFVERTNRDLSRFFESIRYSDFSQSFSTGPRGRTFDELNSAFTSIMERFREARSEKEEQYRYLQTLLQHIGLGVISFDQDGDVDLINNAAKRLLTIHGLRRIEDLRSISPELTETLRKIESGERELVRVKLEGENLQLIVSATEFRQRDRALKLISMQNIESELAEKEMEAWQKLISVLTHEIMNSVTPIASLASTVGDIVRASNNSDSGLSSDERADIDEAVGTIERRCTGLLSFVQSYRKLTKVPTPKYEIVPLRDLFDDVYKLLARQTDEAGIDVTIEIDPETLEITADRELIEQVLINILINAIQALKGNEDPRIVLRGATDDRGRSLIEISDNGTGMDDEIREKVFTPFFTTRRDGSGIGLSLSRQIMRLHKGRINVDSTPGVGSTFTLRF